MEFKIKRKTLLNSIAKVSRAVSMKSPLPALTGIKFELTDHELILTGSDTDITIQTSISNDIDIIERGSVILSSKYIFDIVRKLDDDELTISILDGNLTRIKSSRSTFDLNGTDSHEYPRIDLNKNGLHVQIQSNILKDCIEQTSFATSDKENRPVLTGVNFRLENNVLSCIATDSYRLALKKTGINCDDSFNIIIPKKSLIEISRLIENDTNIDLYISDRKILCVIDDVVIQSRLIDGTFPDTNRLLSVDFSYELSTDSVSLLSAIDRASTLSSDAGTTIKLEMDDNQVKVSSSSQELGSVEEILDQSFYKGEPLAISFSSKYLTEAIKSINSDKVKLSFNGEMKPFIVKNIDEDNVTQLILPVRTY